MDKRVLFTSKMGLLPDRFYFACWKCCSPTFISEINSRQSGHTFTLLWSFAALIYTSLLLLIALFLISFSSILSPYHSFTQFSPLFLCPCSNISYYCPYTSLSSHHSCVLILTCFIVFPVSSCSLFSHFISRLLTDISCLPNSFSDNSCRWLPGEDSTILKILFERARKWSLSLHLPNHLHQSHTGSLCLNV